MSNELNWNPIRNGLKATAKNRTYYVATFHGDIHVSYADGDSTDLTNLKWGDIADIDAAKAIAEQHASN
jgi:hypothetical protein